MSDLAKVDLPTQCIIYESNNVSYTVGKYGDFTSLNSALTYLSQYSPGYKQSGVAMKVILLDDFVMNEQIILSGIDLSWVEVFAESTVKIARNTLKVRVENYLPVFSANNGGRLPLISALFDMDYIEGGKDISVAFLLHGAGSSGNFSAGSGCINAFGDGLLALSGASFSADNTLWNHCAGDGVSTRSGASGSANDSEANHCYNGFLTEGAVLSAQRSVAQGSRSAGFAARMCGAMNAEASDAQNGDNYGYYASTSSLLNVTRGNCSGCRFGITAQRGSKIAAEEVIADNCTETNISARRYAEIEAQSCHAVNTQTTPLYCIRANYSGSVIVESGTLGGSCTDNICRATTNAEIQATDAQLSGAIGKCVGVFVDESANFNGRRMTLDHSLSSGTAVQVSHASTADLSNSSIYNAGYYGVLVQHGANVSLDDATVRGSHNYSLYVLDGGKVSAIKADLQQTEGTDARTNIVISRGGIISAAQSIGGVYTEPNTITDAGIIFK